MTTRRTVLLGLTALAMTACVNGGGGSAVAQGPGPGMTPVPNAGYDAWVAAFRPRAAARGVSTATYDAAFARAGYLPGVIEKDRSQTEFKRSLQDYLAIAASDERVSKGRAALARHRAALDQISTRYGVEPQVIVAVWGLESYYGERRGEINVISATSTLAYDGRRGEFFQDQLVAALKILQNGDTTPANMTGSWAGAMGHTQFIPTSYQLFAVDFTGDGRRDIWSDDPTDSLASTAAYLARSGWTRGQPWGVEVLLPAGFAGPFGRGTTRSAADWGAMGVRDMNGKTVPNHGPSSILAPSGPNGPAFMVFRNFGAILRYNNAENYAIGVGHLSDRIAGGPPIRGSFPPDAQGLTIADRQEIQRRLTAKGFDTGGTDGVIGAKSQAAISAWQTSVGRPATGQATQEVLQALR